MTLAANALQRSIYERLSDQLDTPVYDHVPQGEAFPYVVIGADTSIPWDTKGCDGQEFTCTIHCWDALVAGRKSVKATMGAIYEALHHREEYLNPAGFAVAEMRCEYSDSFQEPGMESGTDHHYHGVLRFRALVEELPVEIAGLALEGGTALLTESSDPFSLEA